MKTVGEIRQMLARQKVDLAARFGVTRLAIFGSWARAEESASSDLDVLVEFDKPIGREIVDLREHLESTLDVKGDLVPANAVRRTPKLWQTIQQDLLGAEARCQAPAGRRTRCQRQDRTVHARAFLCRRRTERSRDRRGRQEL